MVLSREDDTICFLPGLKWTDVMASLCPLNCWYSSGSDMFLLQPVESLKEVNQASISL